MQAMKRSSARPVDNDDNKKPIILPKVVRFPGINVSSSDDNELVVDERDYRVVAEILLMAGIDDLDQIQTKNMISVQENNGEWRVDQLRIPKEFNLSLLPDSIGELEHLKKLDLSGSKIALIPSTIGKLKNLKHLELSGTKQLVELPQEIGSLASLEKLYLEKGSGVKLLPSSIGLLKNIEILDLDEASNLSQLPQEIGSLVSLDNLCLMKTSIKTLPDEIGNLASLRILNLNNLNINGLPSSIGNLMNLDDLRLYDAKNLKALPDEFNRLTSLNYLSLEHSGVKLLPEFIVEFKNMEELYLGSTEIQFLPKEIGSLTKLEILHLGKSSIKSIPSSIGQMAKLKQLWLQDTKNLLELPKEIGQLKNLNNLSLDESAIKLLPSSIGRLKNLKRLCLQNTRNMFELPKEIGQLESLEYLDIEKSAIKLLPSSIGSLKNLKDLWLGCTRNLSHIPEEIQGMRSLKNLNIWKSPIVLLPDSIGSLVNLRILHMAGSGVTSLPESLQKLQNLMHLNLRGAHMTRTHQFDYFMTLVQSMPSIGDLDIGKECMDSDQKKRLGFDLACNRSRHRLRCLISDEESAPTLPKLWPQILSVAMQTFDKYRTFEHYDWICKDTPSCKMNNLDAIHEVLLSSRESFVQLLIDHKERPPIKRKVYFSYSNVHNDILKMVPKIKVFDPSVVIAINGGGFLALALRAELKIPFLSVFLELKTNEVNSDQPIVQKHQWIDEESECGKKVFDKKVLIVTEVDDSRAMLQYCVDRIAMKNPPSNISVAALHNRQKQKKGVLPNGIVYIEGATVQDHWDCCYPWDVALWRNSNAPAVNCSFDW